VPSFCGDATSVAVDSRDNVYVFNRGPTPVLVFSPFGELINGWGSGQFKNPHGIAIDQDDYLYLIDEGAHVVEKRSTDGRLLLTIGKRNSPAAPYSGLPFNRPTDAAIHPVTGEIFVSDGYENAAIHVFDSSGRHLRSWGSSGTLVGEFFCPHNIALIDRDRLVVCDRENYRLQFFSTAGEFIEQWHVFRPCAARLSKTHNGQLFVGELGPNPGYFTPPSIGNCVEIFHVETRAVLTKLGTGEVGMAPDQFLAPHGIAIDSRGTLYVAEVSQSFRTKQRSLFVADDGELKSLRRWVLSLRA
jgi:DNA-binding beta-propeller fold protein YncE